jgi:hypothetical protein
MAGGDELGAGQRDPIAAGRVVLGEQIQGARDAGPS